MKKEQVKQIVQVLKVFIEMEERSNFFSNMLSADEDEGQTEKKKAEEVVKQ